MRLDYSIKQGFIILLILVFLMSVTGCTGTRYVAIEHTVEKTDSVILTDTVVSIQLVPYRDSINTDSSYSYLSNPYAYSYASYDGKLHHSLGIFLQTTPVSIQVPKEYVYVRERKEVPVQVERKLTKWEQTKLNYGGKAIVLCIACIILVISGCIVKK